jgi:predicted transcriptional regulator
MKRYLSRPCSTCGSTGVYLDGTGLRKLRQEAGLSLRHVAGKAGITAGYLCDLELNRRNLNEEMWERLGKVIEGRR